jgi:signal transduction histidine kinase
MKLLNRSLKYLSLFILIVVGIWSVIFYLNFRENVYEIVDESLEDQLELLGDQVREDSSLLNNTTFENQLFSITPIGMDEVILYSDEVYKDTLMTLPYDNDLKNVRLITEAYQVNGEFYKFQAVSSTVEEEDLIESLFWFIVWLYVALILTVVFVNNWALKRLWSPFYHLLNSLKQFRVDEDSSLPEIKTGTTEFRELKQAADELIERTIRTYANQKQFTENAAHELQTPIAIITSKLELLIERATLSAEDAEKIAEVLDITSQLKQLNKSLLLLSRIDNKQYESCETISVNDLIKSLIKNLEDVTLFKDVNINLKEDGNSHIYVNTHLAKILFRNLLVNAINHNKSDGKVVVTITDGSIKICNTSTLPELDKDHLYERFSKNRQTQKGTGLGLAIVHAICDLYDFNLHYSYNGLHCFTIKTR